MPPSRNISERIQKACHQNEDDTAGFSPRRFIVGPAGIGPALNAPHALVLPVYYGPLFDIRDLSILHHRRLNFYNSLKHLNSVYDKAAHFAFFIVQALVEEFSNLFTIGVTFS